MFLYRSLSFLTIYVWRSILKYNTTFLYWCKNIDSYYRDEILNPPDPTRFSKNGPEPYPTRSGTRPDPSGRVGLQDSSSNDIHPPYIYPWYQSFENFLEDFMTISKKMQELSYQPNISGMVAPTNILTK